MKVLHINTKNHEGGAALVARSLHTELRNQGVDSTFLAGRGDKLPNEGIFTLPVSRARLIANVLSYRALQTEAPLNTHLWKALWEKYIEPADIIHLHNPHGYYIPDPVLSNFFTKPLVWTLHDFWLLSGRCGFHGSCTGHLSGCPSCPHKDFYPRTWIDHAAMNHQKRRQLPLKSCTLVTPSSFAKNRFITSGFSDTPFKVIPNPVTLAKGTSPAKNIEALRAELGLVPEKTTLLFVAENLLNPRKGFQILSEVLKQIKRPKQYQLLLVGKAREKPQLAVKTIYAEHIANRNDLALHYQLAELVIIPSTEETFGMVGPEALSCGASVICNDLPVFRETMEDQATYISENNPSEYARAIESHSSFKEKKPPPLIERWEPASVALNYQHLYSDILNRG